MLVLFYLVLFNFFIIDLFKKLKNIENIFMDNMIVEFKMINIVF